MYHEIIWIRIKFHKKISILISIDMLWWLNMAKNRTVMSWLTEINFSLFLWMSERIFKKINFILKDIAFAIIVKACNTLALKCKQYIIWCQIVLSEASQHFRACNFIHSKFLTAPLFSRLGSLFLFSVLCYVRRFLFSPPERCMVPSRGSAW